MIKIIKNAAHKLLPDQVRALTARFPQWETIEIPEEGITLEKMKDLADSLSANGDIAVFMSPIPGLMALCASKGVRIHALHNDRREAIETRTPDGKVILRHVVAREGWEIVP